MKIDIVPTEWVHQRKIGSSSPGGAVTAETEATPMTLSAVACAHGWGHSIVVKPTVSADGYDTHLAESAEAIAELEATFVELVSKGDVMIQPFVSSIRSHGELLFVFIGGSFTHCIRKTPSADVGGFFVHEHRGGRSVHEKLPPPLGRAFAEGVVAAASEILGEVPLYSRVDVLVDDTTGKYLLSELEITEPGLYPEMCPQSMDALASKIKDSISNEQAK